MTLSKLSKHKTKETAYLTNEGNGEKAPTVKRIINFPCLNIVDMEGMRKLKIICLPLFPCCHVFQVVK